MSDKICVRPVIRYGLMLMAALFHSTPPAVAQENALGPPPALQFPYEATPDAPRGLASAFLRADIERGADTGLCLALMLEAGRQVPANFTRSDCEPAFAAKVANNEGIIHWKGSSARPLKCGANCVGRPFMSTTDFLDRPNLRRAMLYGQLRFLIDPPGPINRDLTYGYEVYFTCKAENGARHGELEIETRFGQPVVGDPGAVEAFLDFVLLPANLTRLIDAEIKSYLQSLPGQSVMYAACASVGVERASNPLFDTIKYDIPPGGAGSAGAGRLAATAAVGDRATVRLLRITRRPLPPNVAPEHAHPGQPEAGYFSVYINGAHAFIPGAPGSGIDLPPQGGDYALNHCRTVDLAGADRLQIIFTNGLGGGVWSQFRKNESFGSGKVRTMTTGRNIVIPAAALPPRRSPGKPQTVSLREFELTYQIDFAPTPTVTADAARPTAGPRGAVAAPRAGVAVDRAAPAPCTPI